MNQLVVSGAGVSAEWRFSVSASHRVNDRPVWFYIMAGPIAGGLHLSLEECDTLARMLGTAHSEALRDAEKMAEARLEMGDALQELGE